MIKSLLPAKELTLRIKAARQVRHMSQRELNDAFLNEGLRKEEAGRLERGDLPLTSVRLRTLVRVLSFPASWFTDPHLFAATSVDDLLPPRIDDIRPEQQAARIRAAIGYSGKEINEVARELGISEPTLWRRANRQHPTGAKSMDELYAVAEACSVPRRFMEAGFAALNEMPASGTTARLDRLEEAFSTLNETVVERLATLAEKALEPEADKDSSAGHRQAT